MIVTSQKRVIHHCGLMQASLGALGNPCAAVVIHSTRSCSVIVKRAYETLSKRYEVVTNKQLLRSDNLFCTGITEEDTVFGTLETLRACLLDIISVKRPEYILIAVGCVPGMIGDDVESVCQEVEREFEVPVFVLPGHGFMVPEGIDTVLSLNRILIDRFTLPLVGKGKKDRSKVAILGASIPYFQPEDYADLKEFFSVLGFTTIFCPPFEMSRKEYESLAEAFAIFAVPQGVLKRDAAVCLARYVANEMHGPGIFLETHSMPVACTKQLIAIGEKLACKEQVIQWITPRMAALERQQSQLRTQLQGQSCVIHIRNPRAIDLLPDWCIFLQETGFSAIQIKVDMRLTAEQIALLQRQVVDAKCSFDRGDTFSDDYHFVSMPFNLAKVDGILLPSGVGFSGYEALLQNIEREMERRHG
ncbi:MAG: nitrogenase component 1 [Veillonellaceae bacterium]|nr:nitrogenase component 1 [Veillonellaceae bacterium]